MIILPHEARFCTIFGKIFKENEKSQPLWLTLNDLYFALNMDFQRKNPIFAYKTSYFQFGTLKYIDVNFNCEYLGFGSPLNYKGFTANASGKARLSGKIPQALRARMIFPRNPEGPALPSEKRRLPTLPGSSPVCQWLYMPPFPFRTCFHYPCFHKAWNTKRAVLREDSPVLQGIAAVYMPYLFHLPIFYAGGIRIPGS